jgi:methionine sulfoxide reductase heme-binding subunit
MTWLKKNWVWLIINLITIMPLISVLLMVRFNFSGEGSFISINITERMRMMMAAKGGSSFGFPIHSTGEWAIRTLVASLTITPLCILIGTTKMRRYRKLFGLYAFTYSVIHLIFFLFDKGFLPLFSELNLILALAAMLIIIPLGATSNRWAMRFMNKNWKIFQRTAYAAGVLSLLHVVLLPRASFMLYAVVLSIGFIVRIPVVKQYINKLHNRTIKPVNQAA